MTVRSLPITIGDEDLFLRYLQDDVIAAEREYKIGYTKFFDQKLGSLSLYRTLLFHGLKTRLRDGKLARRCHDKEEAGELVRLYLSEHYPEEFIRHIYVAFMASGWVLDPKDDASKAELSEAVEEPKN